jgi:GTP-binding protein
MSTLPKLAIVGRPNVGKSALFNCICQKRIAIVDEAEGITRDRLYSTGELFGRPFEIIDTGGIDLHSKAPYNAQIRRQAEIAIEEADSLIFVVDGQHGVTALDIEVARILMQTRKPVCLAVNKIDHPDHEWQMHNCQMLGIKRMVAVSATQRWHIAELLELALADVMEKTDEVGPDLGIKVAIIGRPNVGKSSLLNYLMEEERCIVSPLAGTTRDSIDIPFNYGDDLYTLIDTAGIRRKNAEKEVVDKFAALRTERAIERADVCVLMLDAQQGMTTQEKRIATQIEEAGKGCLLVFNKWDLVKGFRMEHCLKGIEEEVSFLKHCPKLFISAKTGRNVEKLFDAVKAIAEDSKLRITTHQLNKFIAAALQKTHPPMIGGKRLRIYYMAQVDIQPPTFVLFVNRPELMLDSYKKYIINQFREKFAFTGCPLRLYLRGKERTERPDARQEDKPQGEEVTWKDTDFEGPDEEEVFDPKLDPSWYS